MKSLNQALFVICSASKNRNLRTQFWMSHMDPVTRCTKTLKQDQTISTREHAVQCRSYGNNDRKYCMQKLLKIKHQIFYTICIAAYLWLLFWCYHLRQPVTICSNWQFKHCYLPFGLYLMKTVNSLFNYKYSFIILTHYKHIDKELLWNLIPMLFLTYQLLVFGRGLFNSFILPSIMCLYFGIWHMLIY